MFWGNLLDACAFGQQMPAWSRLTIRDMVNSFDWLKMQEFRSAVLSQVWPSVRLWMCAFNISNYGFEIWSLLPRPMSLAYRLCEVILKQRFRVKGLNLWEIGQSRDQRYNWRIAKLACVKLISFCEGGLVQWRWGCKWVVACVTIARCEIISTVTKIIVWVVTRQLWIEKLLANDFSTVFGGLLS